MQAILPGETEPGGPWLPVHRRERIENGTVVGDIGTGFGIPGERQVELGYRILPGFHRRGYAREAVAAAVDYLIAEHRTHRFVGIAASLNEPSGALLRSLGFRRQGHFKQSFLCKDGWPDDGYYALLASDWRG